jgi:hypothetical protein
MNTVTAQTFQVIHKNENHILKALGYDVLYTMQKPQL